MTAECPSITELTARELPDGLRAHLECCPRCRTLRRVLPEAETPAAGAAGEGQAPAATAPPARRGAVFAVVVEGMRERLPAIVFEPDDYGARVVPLSTEVAYASDWDLLLGKQLLGYAAAAQVWNHGRVLREQLAEELVELDDSFSELVERMYTAFTTASPPLKEAPTGPPMLTEVDPRRRFQAASREHVANWWRRGETVLAAATLSDVIRAGLERAGGWPAASADDRMLKQLERNRLDRAAVPARELARLLGALQIPRSRALGRLVTQALAATTRPSLPQAQVLARRRAGRIPAQRRPQADPYVEELLALLPAP